MTPGFLPSDGSQEYKTDGALIYESVSRAGSLPILDTGVFL